jgi:transposase InsO family protein
VLSRFESRPAHRDRLAAKHPFHVVLVDFTRLHSHFRSVVVGAVVDLFSRKVLAIRVCPMEPDAAFDVHLLREAIDVHEKPRWIITDLGSQFTSRRFGG